MGLAARKSLKARATVHKTPEATAEAFKWDRVAETARVARLRYGGARSTACEEYIAQLTGQQIGWSDVCVCGMVNRPEHNKSDVTRSEGGCLAADEGGNETLRQSRRSDSA
ncbi:unnamed protein product [Vitrella brassicaformis CCMP3155]|uniref:Uncharacterized protein n=1 Tax=Vitrella brassicaformis (strain CCMP3155) TaxID=1169540 RepID=A0A0G4EUG2_VITBC|nr:unnamed protein product [Vitrella brassicaformis CCMP3155]|eukprot:CEM02289.1 unnamed protein product [Vitrella brassicaformis CCMP3155]